MIQAIFLNYGVLGSLGQAERARPAETHEGDIAQEQLNLH